MSRFFLASKGKFHLADVYISNSEGGFDREAKIVFVPDDQVLAIDHLNIECEAEIWSHSHEGARQLGNGYF